MFEFFKDLEKHTFLLPQEEGEDLFRLAHENLSFSVHKENIPFLLRKEQIYKQKKGKPLVFGCRIKLRLDGFVDEREGEKVFYPGGGKEMVDVLEVLSDEKITVLLEEEKLSFKRLIEDIKSRFGEKSDMLTRLALPGKLKEGMVKDKFFLECEDEEEFVEALDILCYPSFVSGNEGKEEIAWELALIAQEGKLFLRLEGTDAAKIAQEW